MENNSPHLDSSYFGAMFSAALRDPLVKPWPTTLLGLFLMPNVCHLLWEQRLVNTGKICELTRSEPGSL